MQKTTGEYTGGSRGTSLSSVELSRIIPTKYRRLRIESIIAGNVKDSLHCTSDKDQHMG